MPDWEKVIEGLECCTQHGCMCGRDCSGHWGWTDDSHTGMELLGEYRTKCPYGNCETGCVKTLTKDALALLKAQEPRVMTLEEIRMANGGDVWLELSGNIAEDVIFAATIDGCGTKGVSTRYEALDYRMYGVKPYGWRCWTSRPSDEVRRATPWSEQDQREYQAAVEMVEYCERYEPTYNANDGSM